MRNCPDTARPRTFQILLLSALLAPILLVALACGGGGLLSGEAKEPSEIAPPASLTAGGHLRITAPEFPELLDPHDTTSDSALNWVIGLVYSRLFKFSPGPAEGAGSTDASADELLASSRRIECDLCSEYQQIDARTFEITLRADAVWQNVAPVNGRSVTATDVALSIRRQRDEGGINAFLVQNIGLVEVLGARELRLRLIEPDPEILEKLAHPAASIVPPELHALDADGAPLVDTTAVGSGPWQIAEVGTSYQFAKHPNYFERDATGARLPYLDTLEVQFIDNSLEGDISARAAGVLGDTSDIADIQLSDVTPTLAADPNLKVIRVADYGAGAEILLNTESSALSDAEVRRALFLLWDVATWTENIWGEHAAPSYGLTPPAPEDYSAEPLLAAFNDRTEARRILTARGFNSTEPIVITVGDFGDEYIRFGTELLVALQMNGVLAEINVIPTYQFAENVWLDAEFDIAIGAAAPVYSLADKLITLYRGSGVLNQTSYASGELDGLIDEFVQTYEPERRAELYDEITAAVLGGYHRIYATHAVAYWLTAENVCGFYPNTPALNSGALTRVWVGRCEP